MGDVGDGVGGAPDKGVFVGLLHMRQPMATGLTRRVSLQFSSISGNVRPRTAIWYHTTASAPASSMQTPVKHLYELMALSPSEASHETMWAFITCILPPDVVRRRFPGGAAGTSQERLLGGGRGLRNAFGHA